MNKLKHFCTLTDPTTSEYFTRILKIEKIRKCHKVQLESTNRCRRLFRLETGYDKSSMCVWQQWSVEPGETQHHHTDSLISKLDNQSAALPRPGWK